MSQRIGVILKMDGGQKDGISTCGYHTEHDQVDSIHHDAGYETFHYDAE